MGIFMLQKLRLKFAERGLYVGDFIAERSDSPAQLRNILDYLPNHYVLVTSMRLEKVLQTDKKA